MGYINWKRARPTTLVDAFDLCKRFAKAKKNLSIDGIADEMGEGDESVRKWVRYATMPTSKIKIFEMVCGCNYVSDFLTSRNGKLIIDIPTGRKVQATDVMEMQSTFNEAIGLLMKFATGHATVEETTAALESSMCDLAYQRENVQKAHTPELDFGDDE